MRDFKVIRKILGVVLLFIFLGTISVLATTNKINSVKIVLKNGYELETLTQKTKVGDILKERQIDLKDTEKTIPDLNSELVEGQIIKIVALDYEEQEMASIKEKITMEEILATYDDIKEVIETVEQEIPYETETKKVTESEENTESKVLQEGVNGLKQIKYKVTYQNDVETSRVVVSEQVLVEPVTKIIQITQKPVISSRGEVTRTGAGSWSYNASDFDLLCAITAQEGGSSYESSLAVITTACNRAQSSQWGYNGSDPLSQYMAKGQFCYSIDSHWKKRLNGNYPGYVAQAVEDALNGARNHNFLSFRATYTGVSGTQIGGNVYFNPMN